MMHPHRPLTKRKMVQLMVILTILAWATQTLFHQWGYGATPAAETAVTTTTTGPPTVEIRQTASIGGTKITLNDISRYSSADARALRKILHIVVADFATPELRKQLTSDDVRTALRRSGVNPTSVRLSGACDCLVTRIIPASTLASARDTRETGLRPVREVHQQSATQPNFTVNPGDFITVTFDLNSTQAQTVLRAEESGTLGSTIRAKNEATRATHLVTLTSATEAVWTPQLD